MNGKFQTTSSSLFNDKNPGQLPEWMSNLDIQLKDRQQYDLGIMTKGSFAETSTVYRDEIDGSPRQLEASLNDTKIATDAKIQLAKFLSGRYYKVDAKVAGNSANLDVKIDGLPAKFTFNFVAKEGKVNNDPVFSVLYNGDLAEYPFSKAGFDECVGDIKSNRVKTSQKVEAVGKSYLISKEEIVRRYNGKLREATDKINELVGKGDIMGVGSNVFASFYDADYLFPQMEKQAMEAPLPAFEFAPNTEHVATKEHKSASVLAIEADKMLSQLFPDYKIEFTARDNDELLVNAEVLNNSGIRKSGAFCFGIEKEKIASLKFVEVNDVRMTVEQLLSDLSLNSSKTLQAYLDQNKTSAKRIYRGVVLTGKEINKRLAGIIKKDLIPSVIDNWIERGLVTPVNSTTFTTTYSFEELLNKTTTALLSDSEKKEIESIKKYFGNSFQREASEDTGVRNMEQHLNDDSMLIKANEYISKYFKSFEGLGFKVSDEVVNYSVKIFDQETGLSTVINANFGFDKGKIATAYVNLNDEKVGFDNVKKAFALNDSLKKYLELNPGTKTNAPMVMTIAKLRSKIASFTNNSLTELEEVINNWEKANKITKIGSNVFASKYTFEQLLSMSNIKPLADIEIQQKLEKSQRSKYLQVKAGLTINDSNSRDLIDNWSSERMVIHAKAELNKIYKAYDVLDASVNDDSYSITARVINSQGIKQKLTFTFAMVNNKPSNITTASNGKETVDIANLSKLNSNDESLNSFNKIASADQYGSKSFISKTSLKNKLAYVIDIHQFDNLLNVMVEREVLTPVNSATFASNYSMNEIVNYLSKLGKTNIAIANENLEHAKRGENIIHNLDLVMENDTRVLEAKEKKLSPEMEKLKEKILSTAQKAFTQKIITSNKLNQLTLTLNNASSEKDLENSWKDLKKYFN